MSLLGVDCVDCDFFGDLENVGPKGELVFFLFLKNHFCFQLSLVGGFTLSAAFWWSKVSFLFPTLYSPFFYLLRVDCGWKMR